MTQMTITAQVRYMCSDTHAHTGGYNRTLMFLRAVDYAFGVRAMCVCVCVCVRVSCAQAPDAQAQTFSRER